MGKPLDKVEKSDRQVAKLINFGLIYDRFLQGVSHGKRSGKPRFKCYLPLC